MDVSIILPLLVALVPIALFFALVRRRRGPEAPRRAPSTEVSEPAADFGLARDTESEAPGPTAESSGSSTAGAAAAAAGGALIIGYGASHRSGSGEEKGGDNAPDRDGGGHGGRQG
ncbi:hypothetical protein V5F38_15770 [Xanthobacter sp. V0B-10]|uniref:hypothetical protein n=1 Tax=Xanthobacter albus TaxID=3119929 RepID=UPI003729BF7F